MKIRMYFILIIATVFSTPSFAFSCRYAGEFLDYSSKKPGIVRVKINNLGPKLKHGKTLHENMNVEILDVIKGNYAKEEMTLLGDLGWTKFGYINSLRFKVGSEHFISINSNKKNRGWAAVESLQLA